MNIQLIGALAGAALLLAPVGPAAADDRGYANPELLISADALQETIAREEAEPLTIVDVRPLEDFREGHVRGAVHLDPEAVANRDGPVAGALRSEQEIARILGQLGLTAETRIVFYDDAKGLSAARMFWLAEYFGHRKASVLDGGLAAWVKAGYGTETGGAHRRPAPAYPAAVSPRRIATADWILEHRDDEDVDVIDVRPPEIHAAGRIPWAKNIPWSGNLDADGIMKPAAALKARFEAAGVTADRNVALHCQEGRASAHSYLALRLIGYPRVRVYHRSWAEWGSDPALPRIASTDG